jgi:hypothetical protein
MYRYGWHLCPCALVPLFSCVLMPYALVLLCSYALCFLRLRSGHAYALVLFLFFFLALPDNCKHNNPDKRD